jgi:16S rRNA (guanine527-N7)-methyltransferase
VTFKELLAREFGAHGELTSEQVERLNQHHQLLVKWNEKLNLTRIVKLEETVKFHYCESMFLGKSLPVGSLRIVDVGSGAGFPGLPIAVVRPESSVDLVESDRRKAVFLREASRGLPNVKVIEGRAESIVSRYDWIVSRAVDQDEVLALSLAPNVALCASASSPDSAPDLRQTGRHWRVIAEISVPWGSNRVLVFHVKHANI